MTTHTAVVHLVGYPGVGKYTIANELARHAGKRKRPMIVVDNHHTSNVILSVLPVDGVSALPDTVWDHVGEVRAVLMRAIKELSPADWSFVFTNVMTEGIAADQQTLERVRELAEARDSHYVPVRLTCHVDELLRRVARPDRAQRKKWVDPEAVAAFVGASTLIGIDHPALLDLDVTHLTPREAAQRILGHLEELR